MISPSRWLARWRDTPPQRRPRASASVIATRALAGASGLMIAAGVVLPLTWLVEDLMERPTPLVLAPVTVHSPPTLGGLTLARNPFAADGQGWLAPGRVAASAPASERILGVARLPHLSALITPDGFVRPGEPFAGGTLREIGESEAVIDAAGGEKRLPLPAPAPSALRDWLKFPGRR